VKRAVWSGVAAGIALAGVVCALQRTFREYPFREYPFREYPGIEYSDFPLPPDAAVKSEWVFARLMYPSAPTARFARWGADWSAGQTSWTQDYPRADRHFAMALRRLTRIDVRSVEQPVNLDDGEDVFNYPWLYAVQVGEWKLTEAQARKLREYLLRGGFFMADDFWGIDEWAVFKETMQRVFPDRPIVEIANQDAIFHTIYDLDDRYQVPGEWSLRMDRPYRNNGADVHWRGIFDDEGRVMVAISLNSDLGDSWEWADAPHYPERYSALGIRIGVNYVTYAMTH
jgi:hypothetical protein